VSALARGLEILQCFGPGDRWLGNQEIAERASLAKPTVSRLTHTLTELEYLKYSESLKKYALGARVRGLGFAALAQMDVRRVARPLMQALSENTHACVNLGVSDGLWMVYIDRYSNASSYTVQLDVGSRVPIATTSMGRAYLCGLPENARRPMLERLREAHGGEWPRVKKGVDQAFREFEEYGFCLGLGDWRREVHAIAAPLVAPDAPEPLVFSCTGPGFQLTQQALLQDIGPRLLTLVGNVRSALKNL
jgi:DNA-binding IclR family transcriptional regulator